MSEPMDDEYNSASDEDFNPDNAGPAVENEGLSSSEDEAEGTKPSRTTKRKVVTEDVDFDNSGDEATIKKARRKKRKGGDDDDDEGGDGGLIKTRAQRRAEIQERRPLVNAADASVDVDALWTQMANAKKAPESSGKKEDTSTPTAVLGRVIETKLSDSKVSIVSSSDAGIRDQNGSSSETLSMNGPRTTNSSNEQATITIRRTYEFAGETMTEEKVVPATSAEARLYLEEQSRKTTAATTTAAPPKPGLRRPKKRASMFGPGAMDTTTSPDAAKGPKLTTLQKSKLDWAQHVDQEGISEELDEHRKAKEGYLGRMDFLGRMDLKKEEELQKGKQK